MNLEFQIDFDSDFHVASGFGIGAGLDVALFRDADGVVALRGTLLEGLFREAMVRLFSSQALSRYELCDYARTNHQEARHCPPSRVTCPVCQIMGSPAQSKRWHFSTARPQGMEIPLGTSAHAGPSFSQIVHRSRMDPVRRRSKDRMLFSEEYGDAMVPYRFTLESDCVGVNQFVESEAALLVAAGRALRNLGKNRRRGAGACRISPVAGSRTTADWLELFSAEWIDKEGGSSGRRSQDRVGMDAGEVTVHLHRPPQVRKTLLVRLDEPVSVPTSGSSGNDFDSGGVIAGSTVLGAFASRVLAKENGNSGTLTSDSWRRFAETFLRGGARFPQLYPMVRKSETIAVRGMPVPRDLLTCQVKPSWGTGSTVKHPAFSSACDEDMPVICEVCGQVGRENIPLKQGDGFLTQEASPVLFEPSLVDEMHNRILHETGKTASGALFSYTSLAPGQYFSGEMEFPDEEEYQNFLTQCDTLEGEPFTFWLGRSSHRQGRCRAVLIPEEEGGAGQCGGFEYRTRDLFSAGRRFSLLLLADTILYDCWSRCRGSLDAELLNEWLGGDFIEPDSVRIHSSSREVDGWNNHFGLPRWRDTAITAGSSISARWRSGLSDEEKTVIRKKMEEVELSGVGLRQNEGFGRIMWNHPVYFGYESEGTLFVNLPDNLLSGGVSGSDQWKKQTELEYWQAYTEIRLNNEHFSNERWLSVSRWLHTRSASPVEKLQADMGRWGACSVFGSRSKENYFEKGGARGREILIELIGEIDVPGKFEGVESKQQAVRVVSAALAARCRSRHQRN